MTNCSFKSFIISIIFATSLSCSSAEAQWVKKPSAAVLNQTPGLIHETFNSKFMRTTVGYSVVLPPNYKKTKRRYPVVYWLHGGGGNECSSLFTAKSWRDLYPKKRAREIILVYPNGFRSGYMDHHNGKIMIESMIIQELIPRIDDRYRTIATRAGRAVHGFSMGSSGALRFVFKFPDMFCSAVAYGGGAVDLKSTKSQFILNILEKNLKSDQKLIQQNNTYYFLDKNHLRARQNGLKVLLICGEKDSWKQSAVTFLTALKKKKIACDLTLVPGVGHNLRGLMKAEGTAAAKFQDEIFRNAAIPGKKSNKEKAPKSLNESYFSEAEGRSYGFQIVLPPGYKKEMKYPLFVQVFGGANLLPTHERPFIRVRPSGRGVWGYRSMSRFDVTF